MIHIAHKDYPLSSQNRAPSLKPIHQCHSIITYKTTNQAKKKKKKQLNFLPQS
jgi:hypothetical protein